MIQPKAHLLNVVVSLNYSLVLQGFWIRSTHCCFSVWFSSGRFVFLYQMLINFASGSQNLLQVILNVSSKYQTKHEIFRGCWHYHQNNQNVSHLYIYSFEDRVVIPTRKRWIIHCRKEESGTRCRVRACNFISSRHCFSRKWLWVFYVTHDQSVFVIININYLLIFAAFIQWILAID